MSAEGERSRATVSRADGKTGDARLAERHFPRSGEQWTAAEPPKHDNIARSMRDHIEGGTIMYCVRNVTEDLYWVGANDHRLHLFENIHPIPRGVSYNAYLLLDEKTVLFDTVDWSVCRQLLENIEHLLDGRPLDYLVINHMEPDHGASIEEILLRWPEVKIISTEKSFMFMRQFGFQVDGHELIEVKEGDGCSFGRHNVTFVAAPMVHWPEAMVTFDTTDGVLFSADAFGSFGALDGKLFADEVNFDRDWIDDARRYLTNIVGKYGPHIQLLLKKAGGVLDQIK